MTEGLSDDELKAMLDQREKDQAAEVDKSRGHVVDQLQAKIKDEDRKKGKG